MGVQKDLRQRLQQRGLPHTGSKAELIERLWTSIQARTEVEPPKTTRQAQREGEERELPKRKKRRVPEEPTIRCLLLCTHLCFRAHLCAKTLKGRKNFEGYRTPVILFESSCKQLLLYAIAAMLF